MKFTGDPVRDAVYGRNLGLCQITGRVADPGEWAHRISRGRQGTYTAANGLWLNPRVHAATHQAVALAYRAGWMVHTNHDPNTVPALIRSPLSPAGAWHVLGDPTCEGFARWADPAEVEAAGLDPAFTLADALHQLRVTTGLAA